MRWLTENRGILLSQGEIERVEETDDLRRANMSLSEFGSEEGCRDAVANEKSSNISAVMDRDGCIMFRFLTPAVFKTSNSDQLNHILGHELVITEKSFCRFVVLDCDHFINVGFTRQRGREAQWNGNNATRRHLWALSEWTASEGPDVWVHAPVANKVAQAHAERPISGLCAISRGSPNGSFLPEAPAPHTIGLKNNGREIDPGSGFILLADLPVKHLPKHLQPR